MSKNISPTPEPDEDALDIVLPEEDKIAETPAEKHTEKLPVKVEKAPSVPPALYAVTTSGDCDDIYLSKMIPNNIHAIRSLSVFHLQRRLADWGCQCLDENEGFYGEGTINAVKKFQDMKGFDATGIVTYDMLVELFTGDNNVCLHA